MQNFIKWVDKTKRYRYAVYVSIILGLSVYKPLALFQTLALMQTFFNIIVNTFIYYTVGAAVYLHNLGV